MTINLLTPDLEHILHHTHDLWEELRGAHLFITGGTGFFGCWLLESFLHANQVLDLDAHASILTRNPVAAKQALPHLMLDPSITLIEGDVRDFEFPLTKFSHIIHAATNASAKLNEETPLLMLDTIIEGTRHTLNFANFCGAKKFLFTSSGAVYGNQPPDMTHIPEDYHGAPDPLDPKSAYGEGKRLAEHLCSLYATSTLEIKIARCFAFVGPYLPLDTHFAIGNFIRDSLSGSPIVIQGDGTPYRSYLYMADLAIWLWTILFRGASLRPYNVGSEDDHPIADIAKHVAEQFEPPTRIEIRTPADPLKPISRYVPKTQFAQEDLSLSQTISLDSAITRTIQWHQKQGPTK